MSFKPLSNGPYAERRSDPLQVAYVACLRAIHAEELTLDEADARELVERLRDHCHEYAAVLMPQGVG